MKETLITKNDEVVAKMVDIRQVRNILINELKIDREFIREVAESIITKQLDKINVPEIIKAAASNRALLAVRQDVLAGMITKELQRLLAEQIVINVTTK